MFLDILPDPNYKINPAGAEDVAGTAGPGFLGVALELSFDVDQRRTIKGKTTISSMTRPGWMISLQYNPLTKPEFSPVYNFLLQKQGTRAFYISLPQYKCPKDSTFATFVETTTPTISGVYAAGVKSIDITTPSWSGNTYVSGLPSIGDVFTIADPDDSLHKQAYMISHVDDYVVYDTQANSGTVRVHFFPGLQRATSSGSDVEFNSPLFRVKQALDVQEYSLDNDNLYAFSLKLQEALQ